MRIAILQLDIQWMDAAANMKEAARLMDRIGPADLYILPEMWATGFCTSPTLSTDQQSQMALEWMRQQALDRDTALAGSLAIREWPAESVPGTPALWRNRFFFIHPDGNATTYDKRNLFIYGGEQLTYAAGHERVTAECCGRTFLLQTCFDLRYPESGRNEAAAPYDAVIYVANWPQSRRAAWDVLLQARAIENQALCIGVNRTGTDPHCIYDGGSAVVDAYGHCIARLDNGAQAYAFETDFERQAHLREKFPVLI